MTSAFDQPYRGGFAGGEHRFALSVYYEDTDAAGVVYYANYLRFIERARSDMLRALGIDYRTALESGVGGYVVAEVSIKYLRSARVGDDLLVRSLVETVGTSSLAIHQRVMRGTEQMATARVNVVFVGPEGRPKRQPKEWIERLRATMSEEG